MSFLSSTDASLLKNLNSNLSSNQSSKMELFIQHNVRFSFDHLFFRKVSQFPLFSLSLLPKMNVSSIIQIYVDSSLNLGKLMNFTSNCFMLLSSLNPSYRLKFAFATCLKILITKKI